MGREVCLEGSRLDRMGTMGEAPVTVISDLAVIPRLRSGRRCSIGPIGGEMPCCAEWDGCCVTCREEI